VINVPDGVEGFFGPLFEMGVTGHKLELIEAREEGDAVVAAANRSATGKDGDGNDQPGGGVATHVFERQADGSLKLTLHAFN
jgi:ketosteroid isomerase-like protein